MKKDITKKTVQELQEEIVKAAAKAREIRFGGAGAQSKNTKVLRNNRRSVARMKTALRSQELAVSKKNA